MYEHIKQSAAKAYAQNNITKIPIPIYLIEQIIIDHDYDIMIIPGTNKSCIIGQTLFTQDTCDNNYRFSLAHELGHIILYNFLMHTPQAEARADAFAAYFLMPPKSFETNAKFYNIYELTELYGVPYEAVKNRFKLILEINN